MRGLKLLGVLVVCLPWTMADADSAQRVSTTFPMPVRIEAAVEASECENAPGPEVTLNGVLGLGGMGMDVIFRNNEKGTHTATDESIVNAVFLPAGESLEIPKQPVLGGVGGNPFMWVQMVDGAGQALSQAVFMGRCVQGSTGFTADVHLPATATAELESEACYNNPGPFITLGGELSLSGLNARFIFSNNDNPVGGPHRTDEITTMDVVLIPAGQSIQIPKQPVLGGVGGNPWISVLFRDGDAQPIGREFLLGRCVQLSK